MASPSRGTRRLLACTGALWEGSLTCVFLRPSKRRSQATGGVSGVEPRDLKEHQGIRRRFAGGALEDRWSFACRARSIQVKVSGRLIVDDAAVMPGRWRILGGARRPTPREAHAITGELELTEFFQ